MHGKNTTPRVPLTTSGWAKPTEDTGSEYAHTVTLQGSLVHLQVMGQPCPLYPAGAAELGWELRPATTLGGPASLPSEKQK